MRKSLGVGSMLAAVALISALPSVAYYHFVYYVNGGIARAKFDLTALPGKTVRFFVSETGPTAFSANDNFASVVNQVRQATQVWNEVSTSDLRVAFGGFEHANTLQNTPAGDVVFEDLPPGLLGYGGPTILSTAITPAGGVLAPNLRGSAPQTDVSVLATAPFVPITRAAIHLNVNGIVAPFPSYSQSFFMVLVHEMGHALGLQHTFTSATMSTATTASTSVMNPLDADDIAGISVLYPNAAFSENGSIAGHVTSSGNPLHLESVVAIRAGAPAVSTLTNPDGSYEIDGIPPGRYFVYAHALPPDADIAGPWNSDGSVAAASGATTSLFYPGTTDVLKATPLQVAAAAQNTGIDIDLSPLPSVPIYDVSVYGYYANNTVAIKPAYLNMLGGPSVAAASGIGLGSNGQAPGLSAQFMGETAVITTGGVQPYQANGYTYLALDIVYFLFGAPGPQHLVINTPGYMHVLPSAIRLTLQNPPTIQSVSDNGDGTLSVTGTNWASGSVIYFDGAPAATTALTVGIGSPASAKAPASTIGTATVTPPPGISGQTAILTVYNPDGQNSQFVQSATPVTYTYATLPAPAISSISPSALPAGAEAMVDITGTGFNFVAGKTDVGFGTSDVVVRQVFVLSPNHLQVDVSVAPGAALSSPDVSVFTGFQMATSTAGFHVTPAVNGLPAAVPVLTNALPGLTGAYAGAVVSLYGTNLAAGTPVALFNGEAASILYSSPTQLNLQIPGDLPPGPVLLQVNNGTRNGYPVVVNIDTPPAAITTIQDAAGNPIGASFPAVQQDLLTVSLTGFAPDGKAVPSSQVQVSVNGVVHPALSVVQSAPGIYQVSFLLNASEATGGAQTLIVYLNGRSSYPVTIPVIASARSGS